MEKENKDDDDNSHKDLMRHRRKRIIVGVGDVCTVKV